MSRVTEFTCLVLPRSLTFIADDKSTHTQMITLYNAQGTSLSFRILCSSAQHLAVQFSSGTLKPSSSLEVLVRLKNLPNQDEGSDIKLKVEMTDEAKTMRGSAVVMAHYTAPGLHINEGDTDGQHVDRAASIFVATVLSVCLMILAAPQARQPCDIEAVGSLTWLPEVSSTHQLVAAFVLGLTVMNVLQTHASRVQPVHE